MAQENGQLAGGVNVVIDATQASGDDRRRSPRRRLRDRIASLEHTENPALRGKFELQNLMLLVDDDLRQTALSLGSVEQYLAQSIALLESESLAPAELAAHADGEDVLDRVDLLLENLMNLRRRMGDIAARLPSRSSGGSGF